jgi:hypothetical protein
MSNRSSAPKAQPPHFITLHNGAHFSIAIGLTCPHCRVAIRPIDAEPLERGGVLVHCRNNHFIAEFVQ